MRTAVALAVIPLGTLPGLGVWLATRDRRRAIDRIIEAWGDRGTRAAGIIRAASIPRAESRWSRLSRRQGGAIWSQTARRSPISIPKAFIRDLGQKKFDTVQLSPTFNSNPRG